MNTVIIVVQSEEIDIFHDKSTWQPYHALKGYVTRIKKQLSDSSREKSRYIAEQWLAQNG
jgi:hypothetical protein